MKTPILFALAFSLLACSGAAFDVAPGDAAGASVEYSSDASPPGASDADAMSSPGEEMLIARAEAGPDAQPSPEVLGDGSGQADASPAAASDAGADVAECGCLSNEAACANKFAPGSSAASPFACCLPSGACGCSMSPVLTQSNPCLVL